MFGHPGFGGAWYAEDEERPIGYERRNRCFDEAAVSDIFWRDLDAGFGLAAHEISDDGLRRKAPLRRTRAVVFLDQRLKFCRMDRLGGMPQQGFAFIVDLGRCSDWLVHDWLRAGKARTRSAKSRAGRERLGDRGARVWMKAGITSHGISVAANTRRPSSLSADEVVTSASMRIVSTHAGAARNCRAASDSSSRRIRSASWMIWWLSSTGMDVKRAPTIRRAMAVSPFCSAVSMSRMTI